MSRDISAFDARRVRQQFRSAVAEDRARYARTATDKNLSDSERKAALEPLSAGLAFTYKATAAELAPLQEMAEYGVAHYSPAEVRRRAAGPGSGKAASAAAIAALESTQGLMSMARNAVAAKDDATAHGIALAMQKREDISPEDRRAILDALDAPHAARAERAISALVGVSIEVARHAAEGPTGEALSDPLRDPAESLRVFREATSYTDPTTTDRVYLTDSAATDLLDAAGVLHDIPAPDPVPALAFATA